MIAPNEQIVVGKRDNQLSFEQNAGVPQYVSSIQVIDGFLELHKIRSYHDLWLFISEIIPEIQKHQAFCRL